MSNPLPPGPKGHFLLGAMPDLQHDRLNLLLNNREIYGDIVYLRGPRPIYQLNNPDDIQYVLVKGADKFEKSPMLKQVTGPVLGKGLLTSDGEFHHQQRKLVQPAFHTQRISSYADVMVDYAARMLDSWRDGETLDIHHEMMALTMGIVAKTLFDANVDDEAAEVGAAISFAIADASEGMSRVIHLPEWLPTAKNQQRRSNREIIQQAVMAMIEERRRSGEDKGDLLSMLLLSQDEDSGQGMDDQQVFDEAMTLFIAGHETTANALTWALVLLAQNPNVEARLMEEIHGVLDQRLPTMADMRQLPYTDQVMKETMRLYPPAWMIARVAIEDVTLGGYSIPAGSVILISQYVMQHDPRYWEAPEAFRPERFAPGWDKTLPKFAYFPFGGGPRVCIGNSFAAMEANLILPTILQRYTLALAPGQAIEMEPLITLRPKGALNMVATAREAQAVQA